MVRGLLAPAKRRSNADRYGRHCNLSSSCLLCFLCFFFVCQLYCGDQRHPQRGTHKEEELVGDGVTGAHEALGATGVTVRKAYKYKLIPTTAQVRQLEETLWRCRTLYNVALEQRITLWKQRGVTLTRYEQEAELKDLRATFPEYAAIHSHVLQDVLARLDRAYQAFFQRVRERQRGETGKRSDFPRFQGRHGNRYHSFTWKEYGNGARLDNGVLVLAKLGRIAVRWSRPLEGTPRPSPISREADGWYVIVSCAEVPIQPLPCHGHRDGH